MRTRLPNVKLTVVIRDVMPLISMQEPVSHRTVTIELTPSQKEQLALRYRGTNCGQEVWEDISQCFMEEE